MAGAVRQKRTRDARLELGINQHPFELSGNELADLFWRAGHLCAKSFTPVYETNDVLEICTREVVIPPRALNASSFVASRNAGGTALIRAPDGE